MSPSYPARDGKVERADLVVIVEWLRHRSFLHVFRAWLRLRFLPESDYGRIVRWLRRSVSKEAL